MENFNEDVSRFIRAADEMMEGKYVYADKKLGELLKTVAESEELTRLFSAVTDGFDYPAAKRAYLQPPKGRSAHGVAYLPSRRDEVLAYVFCLLAEIDSGAIRFGDFLITYFYEDGSFTASYSLFVNRVVRPFRDIVKDCYPNAAKSNSRFTRSREEDVFGTLSEKISVERNRIKEISMTSEDALAGDRILAELYAAVGRKDKSETKALLVGYLYYLNAVKGSAENSDEIFALAAEL